MGKLPPRAIFNYWQMGLLKENDWKVNWIGAYYSENSGERPSPVFRKDFDLKKEIKSATAVITSRGLYDAYINGERIRDRYFTPDWTNYDERIQYQMFDVTELLNKGQNAVRALLGSGL